MRRNRSSFQWKKCGFNRIVRKCHLPRKIRGRITIWRIFFARISLNINKNFFRLQASYIPLDRTLPGDVHCCQQKYFQIFYLKFYQLFVVSTSEYHLNIDQWSIFREGGLHSALIVAFKRSINTPIKAEIVQLSLHSLPALKLN